MKNRNYELKAYVSREIESKPINVIKILAILFFFNFIAFGYFGVIRGFQSYREKAVLIEEYNTVKENLNTNLQIILELAPYVNDTKGVEFVNTAIPESVNSSEYLKSFSRVAASNGFTIQTFSVSSAGNEVSLSVRATGDLADLPDFIDAVEEMDRLTSIQNLDYAQRGSREDKVVVRMTMKIFTST